MSKDKFIRISPIIDLLITIAFSYLFARLGIWQLVIVAAIIGGLLAGKTKWAPWAASLGVLIGWGIYIIIQSFRNRSDDLIDLIGQIIIGQSGFGIYIIILVLFFGALFGLLGGFIGKYIIRIIKE